MTTYLHFVILREAKDLGFSMLLSCLFFEQK